MPDGGDRAASPIRPVSVRAGLAILAAVTALSISACGGAERAAAPPSAHTSAVPQTRIMIVGDSQTEESAGDYTWRYRLYQHLSLTAPGRVDFVGTRNAVWDNVKDVDGSRDYVNPWFDTDEQAVWGLTIATATPHIAAALRDHPTDIMLIMLGRNDVLHASSVATAPAEAAALMKQFIDTARTVNPNLTIVLGHVLWTGLDVDRMSAFNTILDQSAGAWSTPTSKVVIARSDEGWDPLWHTWDGAHPNPDGEYVITRGFANALAEVGVGGRYGPVLGGVSWPGKGRQPAVAPAGAGQVTLTWPATPGATQYFVEQRVVSAGEPGFTRLPGAITGYTWTSGKLAAGATIAFRVVPVKGNMVGQGGPETLFAVSAAR
ncbi:GDSL-type esterase/lipase family protein [Pseudofrankia sp. BMG5.36]|uniref:GDSL-type esterase/lipase family protein n=1 Tax=Pseudofrankia sp. BMG5.36 TaxID=1834512 RepID=UPI0008DA7484|nr:GDSL-type esterase/lipase family protein [Pseudofrankia sp. BMG5.36]OHV54274.1 hypothetical protein BCD48_09440 [Pseudofrankia sp. BMG5.36]